jgi:hypothetical protein
LRLFKRQKSKPEPLFCDVCKKSVYSAKTPLGVVIDYRKGKTYTICGSCQSRLDLKATESGILIHGIKNGHGYVDLDRIERLIEKEKNYIRDAMSEISYADIEREFSKDDLSKYNSLCRRFVALRDGKNNIELWKMVQDPSELRAILDDIHTLREKYDFLKGEMFFKVWRLDPNTNQYEEMCW